MSAAWARHVMCELPLPGQYLHGCLAIGHIPGKWRQVKVVFLPKLGRGYYTGLINPTQFLRKVTKSLVDGYLRLCHCIPTSMLTSLRNP